MEPNLADFDYIKQIPGFPGYYATKDGRIWSEPKRGNHGKGRFLKISSKPKYFMTSLCKEGKLYDCYLHRLILETLVGPCPEGMECRHLNGNPADNRLENLKWGTHSENVQDAVRQNMHVNNSGERNGNAKLTEQDVKRIISAYGTGKFTQAAIARSYNIARPVISNIVNKKAWKHIWRK